MTPARQRVLMIGLIILGILIVGFFGLRSFHAFNDFRGHRPPPPRGRIETDVDKIQEWMTIPFISRAYLIPDRMLFEALDIPEEGNREKSLKDLNDEYYPQEDGFVMETVKAAISERKPPPPPPDAKKTAIPAATATPLPTP